MNEPKLSDLDLYINDIVDKLRAKYGYADKNRLNPYHEDESRRVVRFFVSIDHSKQFQGMSPNGTTKEVIELTYTELVESMNRKELPKQIKELL